FVADAAAGPVGLEAGRTELANHIQGKVTLLFRINHESNKIVTQILRYGNLGYDALPSSYMERLPSRVQSYQTDRTFNPRNLPHDGSPSLGRRLRPRTRLPLGRYSRRYSRGDPGCDGRPRGQSRCRPARRGPRDPCQRRRALASARSARSGRWLAAGDRRPAAVRPAAGLSRLLSHNGRLADADHRHAVAMHRAPC